MKLIFCVILAAAINFAAAEIFHSKVHLNFAESKCTILSGGPIRKYKTLFSEEELKDENSLKVKFSESIKVPGDPTHPKSSSKDSIIEVFGLKQEKVDAHLETLCKNVERVPTLSDAEISQIEIVKVVDGGDPKNRIDVVFMGDGYTQDERDKFFDDMERLIKDMFEGETFRSYLPVFNIWSVFVPSVESGIGYDGPKNTPFQLYREAGQLRAIFPGNPEYARIVCAMTGQDACDYPSIIGNDDFYGGLGGEFVISTKSEATGTIVLRHEMGHNFVYVGEEYDSGYVYRGVNAAFSVESLGWSHWLSGERREEKAMWRILEYPWHDLGISQWVHTFTSDGQYSRWLLSVSVSAAGEEDCLEFLIDGEVLPWTTEGLDDRMFYDWHGDQGFTAGNHTFTVRSKTAPSHPDIPRMICSVNIHEFGNEDEFIEDNTWTSAYPTWDYVLNKSYRPTNAGCLMRNMTQRTFCTTCQEGMWHQFFQRIDLIDNVILGDPATDGSRMVTINTLPLGQLREPGHLVEGEKLEVRWYREGVDQPNHQDVFKEVAHRGNWRVTVELKTPEVLHDPDRLLYNEVNFSV